MAAAGGSFRQVELNKKTKNLNRHLRISPDYRPLASGVSLDGWLSLPPLDPFIHAMGRACNPIRLKDNHELTSSTSHTNGLRDNKENK